MVDLLYRVAAEVELMRAAIVTLITVLALIALIVIVLYGFFAPDREKHTIIGKIVVVLIGCVVVGSAGSLVLWAMSI